MLFDSIGKLDYVDTAQKMFTQIQVFILKTKNQTRKKGVLVPLIPMDQYSLKRLIVKLESIYPTVRTVDYKERKCIEVRW